MIPFTYGSYSIPAYDGDSSEEVNENLPTFSEDELSEVASYRIFAQKEKDNDRKQENRCTPIQVG